MQFSEQWLRTLVNPDLSSEALAHLLTMSGLEVEERTSVAPSFSGVVVGEVLALEKHPNADRLRVCQVSVGGGTVLNIVCGAPNVRVGMKVACAVAGAMLPPDAQGRPFEIKVGQLRGVESHGMLCSAKELGLPDEQDGLLDLPEDAPVGQNFRDYYDLNDVQFTVKLTPNRADCLSVLGVAHEVSALTGQALRLPGYQTVPVTMDEKLPVRIVAPDLCGRFSGRIIRSVNARAKTPRWMKQRLERSGQRSISALVDISNYVMLELGRPTHVFDLEKIKGGLEVRWGKKGETLKLLNGTTVHVDEQVGVIADESGIEALAGIMGGDATAVSLETEHVYVEAAFWHPDAIRGRSKQFNCLTDAAYRFERGVDYATTTEHLERITALIVDICGVAGRTSVGVVDDHIVMSMERAPVLLRVARCEKVVGIPITQAQIADIFSRLGFVFTETLGVFSVMPPSYRFDIEIEEDLIEEVIRVYGFENIPACPPVASHVMSAPPERHRSLFALRHQMADFDYQEVINYSFVDEAWEQDFSDNAEPIRLLNPIASQMSVMRSSMFGGLIANAKYNLNRKMSRVRLFEIGTIYKRCATIPEGPVSIAGYDQPKKLAALAYGEAVEEQWSVSARYVDFFDVKADVTALFAPKEVRFTKVVHPALHPGRSAHIELDGAVIGVIGELHPKWQQKYEFPLAPVLFEVDVAALQKRDVPVYREISKFQPVTRDVAFVVKQSVSVQDVQDVLIKESRINPSCRVMQTVVLFDDYRGKGLEQDEKSLAFRFTLQDTQSMLQDETVDVAMRALIVSVERELGGKLRV